MNVNATRPVILLTVHYRCPNQSTDRITTSQGASSRILGVCEILFRIVTFHPGLKARCTWCIIANYSLCLCSSNPRVPCRKYATEIPIPAWNCADIPDRTSRHKQKPPHMLCRGVFGVTCSQNTPAEVPLLGSSTDFFFEPGPSPRLWAISMQGCPGKDLTRTCYPQQP
jgi:hypothetical protein